MKKQIESFGLQIDIASIENNDEKLFDLVSQIEAFIKNETLTSHEFFNLYYSLGNAWSSIDAIRNKGNVSSWNLENSDFEKSIINYRKAKQFIDENTRKDMQCMLMTNIGNAFSRAGRPIEAIRHWRNALSINSDFKMALGNIGYGLHIYAGMMYDPSHQDIIGREAFKNLNRINEGDVEPGAYSFFISLKKSLSDYYPIDFLSKDFVNDSKYNLGKSVEEKDYWTWVLNNQLFLNPLNDLFKYAIVAHDVLSLPTMAVPKEIDPNDPIFHRFFNTIKQEFISLRYYYYLFTTMDESEIHFSDTNRHLTLTFDYPQYGLKYEYLKISFRMAYSIFDKISYFLKYYLNLKIPDHKVSFRKIWFVYNKSKKCDEINSKIVDLKNLSLRGLFYLSKDFYENKPEYKISLEPEATNIATIRNFIEHKNCTIHWNLLESFEKQESSYHINESDLAEKTFSLIERCREAIIYLSLSVNSEEKKNHSEDDFRVPIVMPEYDFELDDK